MNKYEVILEQVEHFSVIVEAKNEESADDKGCEMFYNGEYNEIGDCQITSTKVNKL